MNNAKSCDCNQGRLPCTCKDVYVPSEQEAQDALADAEVMNRNMRQFGTIDAPKCCKPTLGERRLLASGEYRPEELWGGPEPTCHKCIVKPALTQHPVTNLSFDMLREANVKRCEESFFPLASKDGPWWGNAMAGECGEACNFVKKIDRDGLTPERVEGLAKELADLVTYADLLAARFGINLGEAVISKFNEITDRVGGTIRLEGDVVHQPPALGGEPPQRIDTKHLGTNACVRAGGWNECYEAFMTYLAPLQAEIERLKDTVEDSTQIILQQGDSVNQLKARRDELEALLREVRNENYTRLKDIANMHDRVDVALSKPAGVES